MKKNKQYTARGAAVEVLQQVLDQGAYTNIAINKFLRAHSLEDLERRFFTELVYGTVKAVGTIDWYLGQVVKQPLPKLDKALLAILRLSVYQMVYIDRIPDAAVCNEAVKLARSLVHEGAASFANGVLRGLQRKLAAGQCCFPSEEEDDAGYLALKYCHPRWLIKRWLGQFGREGTIGLLEYNNQPATMCLRVNTLATTRARLMEELAAAGAQVEASSWSKDGIICRQLPALGKLLGDQGAAFYVQDESSMLVASVVQPKPGELVLDMCSAPGGKATHMAQLMENKGCIVARDVHEHKLQLIKDNARRLGVTIIKTELGDGTVVDAKLFGKADRVLVDAPCSGLGVLGRRAEGRWTKTRKDLKLFPSLQLAILHNASRYVKEEGLLVYSTCTIEQSENHYLIEEFLKNHPQWQRAGVVHPLTGELLPELQLLPQVDGIDGFFICALQRKKTKEQ